MNIVTRQQNILSTSLWTVLTFPHLDAYYAYSMSALVSIVLHSKLLDGPFHTLFSLVLHWTSVP